MQIAVLTFDGFNEIDSFVAAHILNRLKPKGFAAYITTPSDDVTSMNGVTVRGQQPLEFAAEADAVIIGSGRRTREIAADPQMLSRLKLDPSRQLIAAQCSGALLLAKLGLLGDMPVCADSRTRPWLIEAGVRVLDTPFVAHGNVATAGGCLASHYLATWLIARLASFADADEALRYVVPTGEEDAYITRAFEAVRTFVAAPPQR